MADFESEFKPPAEPDVDKIVVPVYALVKFADLPDDTKPDIIDIATAAVERYTGDLPSACKLIHETMERIYGPGWHVVIGENFGFDTSYETKNFLYMFFAGNLGVLMWKCN